MKGLLLVLLCLQVFLLFTVFTSTDAAALVTDDEQEQRQPSLDLVESTNVETSGHDQQQQQPPLEQLKGRRVPKKYRRVSSYCSGRPGACNGFRRPPPEPKKGLQKSTPQSFPFYPFGGWKPGTGAILGKIEPKDNKDLKLQAENPTPQRFPLYPFGGWRPGGGGIIGGIDNKGAELGVQTA